MAQERVTIEEIDKYITDLPRHQELAKKIADYINSHDWYNLAQIAQIIEIFYGADSEEAKISGSIAHDIESIF